MDKSRNKTRIIRQTRYTSLLQVWDGSAWLDVFVGGHWDVVDRARAMAQDGWDKQTLNTGPNFAAWLSENMSLWAGCGGQSQAAREMGCTRQTLNRWITGRGLPTLGTLRGVLGAIAERSDRSYIELQSQAFRALAEK